MPGRLSRASVSIVAPVFSSSRAPMDSVATISSRSLGVPVLDLPLLTVTSPSVLSAKPGVEKASRRAARTGVLRLGITVFPFYNQMLIFLFE